MSERPPTREEMILSLAPLVAFHIQSAGARYRLPASTVDEIRSAAWLAAIRAVDSFDPSWNVKLITWADRRIRGSILDWFRDNDSLTRLQRKKVQAGEQIAPRQVPLDGLHLHSNSHERSHVEAKMLIAELLANAGLNPRQEHVIRRYFLDEISLKEAALELGVVESRACQIKDAALKKLRAAAA